ncbi:glycerophosphoryl diester phosphodiesterase membrane domain-containing protein [Nonomuraea rhizosphaerae]|uniref:glycerophosphoryl diester phosphodiesterase membrane domain-containing protein n=1 Tax=Nonomuraea rhizosphaerae TaxID=2665663 RepID=UPI001C5D2436|nr:glycerophosphoryl diester phosphodiesterase membrane domain-containing protein [Nonomuraea rhizosphaerae]
MSDGHGPSPETPPGWAAEQPPPYGAPQTSPWTAPGSQQEEAPPGPGPGPQPAYQQAPYQQPQPGYGYMMQPPPLRPGIIPLRPLTLGDILDGTIKLVRSNPKAVLGLSAIAALLTAIPIAIGQAFVFDSMSATLANPAAADEADLSGMYGGVVAQYGGLIVSYVVSFVVVTLLTGLLTRILGRAVFGGKITAAEAWQLTKSRLPALFGVVGLMALMVVIPLAVFVLLIAALIAAGVGDGSSGQVGVIIAVTLLLGVLYLAYALVIQTRFAFAAPAVVLEGRGAIDALKRSWNLVSGDFWRVLGILILTQLLVGFIAGFLEIPFSLAGTFLGILGAGSVGSAVVATVLIAIGGTLGAMITYPFQAGVAGLLYADRRMRSEAFDLVLQTAAIEQQRQGWVHSSADDLWHPSNSAGQ